MGSIVVFVVVVVVAVGDFLLDRVVGAEWCAGSARSCMGEAWAAAVGCGLAGWAMDGLGGCPAV